MANTNKQPDCIATALCVNDQEVARVDFPEGLVAISWKQGQYVHAKLFTDQGNEVSGQYGGPDCPFFGEWDFYAGGQHYRFQVGPAGGVSPATVDTDGGFDDFLQDATLALREMWESRGGIEIGEMEAQGLNDVLAQSFGDKRE